MKLRQAPLDETFLWSTDVDAFAAVHCVLTDRTQTNIKVKYLFRRLAGEGEVLILL